MFCAGSSSDVVGGADELVALAAPPPVSPLTLGGLFVLLAGPKVFAAEVCSGSLELLETQGLAPPPAETTPLVALEDVRRSRLPDVALGAAERDLRVPGQVPRAQTGASVGKGGGLDLRTQLLLLRRPTETGRGLDPLLLDLRAALRAVEAHRTPRDRLPDVSPAAPEAEVGTGPVVDAGQGKLRQREPVEEVVQALAGERLAAPGTSLLGVAEGGGHGHGRRSSSPPNPSLVGDSARARARALEETGQGQPREGRAKKTGQKQWDQCHADLSRQGEAEGVLPSCSLRAARW